MEGWSAAFEDLSEGAEPDPIRETRDPILAEGRVPLLEGRHAEIESGNEHEEEATNRHGTDEREQGGQQNLSPWPMGDDHMAERMRLAGRQ